MQTIKQLVQVAGTGYQASIGGRMFLIQSCDAGDVLTVTLADLAGNQYSVEGVGAGFKAKPMAGFSTIAITTTADANVQFIVSQGDVDLQLSEVNAIIANPSSAPANVQVQGQGTTSGNPLYVEASGVTLTATNVGINNTSANPVPVSLVSEPGAPVAVTVGNTVAVTLTGSSDATAIPVTLTGSSDTTAIPVTPTQATSVTDQAPVAAPAYNSGAPNQVLLIAAGARRALRVLNPLGSGGNLVLGSSTVTPTNAAIVLRPGDMWVETEAPQLAWYVTSDTGATANAQVIA